MGRVGEEKKERRKGEGKKRGEDDIKRRETKGQEKFPVVLDDWMTNYSLLITKVEDTSPSRQ